MNDFSREQQIPPEEIAKAEAMLTPKQRTMNEARATVLGPLEKIGLSEEEKAIVTKYADRVGELAGQELERLQTESPLKQIIAAMEKYLPADVHGASKRLERIQSVARMADKWQSAVTEKQSLALLQGTPKSQQEVVKLLSEQRTPYDAGRFPTCAGVFVANDADEAKLNNQFLHDLGVLPEGISVDSLFKLPANEWDFSKNRDAIDQVIQDGKPTRILGGSTVIGLKSDRLPGVQFWVDRDRYMEKFNTGVLFTPEAIARSITDIPGVKV